MAHILRTAEMQYGGFVGSFAADGADAGAIFDVSGKWPWAVA